MSTQFLVCMDTSGSMCGSRIKTAKNMVKGVQNCSNYRTFYHFDYNYRQVTEKKFYELNAGGGTCIESTLNGMFNNELPKYKDKETRFFFVTDAEDSIKDKESLRKKLDKLRGEFPKGLHPKILLIASGHCKEPLEYIFGGDNVYHTMDKDFADLAKNLVKATKLTSETKNSINNVTNILNKLTFDTEKNIEETRIKISQIENQVKTIGNNVNQASMQIESARNDYTKINEKYGDKILTATNAVTEEQIENSENELDTLQDEYLKIKKTIIDAQRKANESERKLIDEQRKADEMAKKIKNNDNNLKNKVSNIKKDIKLLIEKIKDIKKFDKKSTEIISTRKEIKKMTKQARLLIDNSLKEATMVQEMEKEILAMFRKMKNDDRKAEEMKKDINNKIEKIGETLDMLFDKA